MLQDLPARVQFSPGEGGLRQEQHLRPGPAAELGHEKTNKKSGLRELPPALPLVLTGGRTPCSVPPCAGCWAAANPRGS